MTIKVLHKVNYGSPVYYPACEKSKIFAQLARTKTLSMDTIQSIKALGYSVEVVSDAPVSL